MRATVAVVLSMLLLLSPAAADEKPKQPPKPLTPEQAADAVSAAVKAKDEKALKALAEKDQPDPWLVADVLLARGRHTAAKAYAETAVRPPTAGLPPYVSARADDPVAPSLRGLVDRMAAELGRGEWDAAIAASEETPAAATVPGVRVVYGRAVAFERLGRWAESHNAYALAAAGARSIGWLRRAEDALGRAGQSAGRTGDRKAARASWTTRVEVAERLADSSRHVAALLDLAGLLRNLDDQRGAMELAGRALRIAEENGARAGVARAYEDIAFLHETARRYQEALAHYGKSQQVWQELGDARRASTVWRDIGNVRFTLGAYRDARDAYQQAVALARAADNGAALASALNNLGLVHRRLGEYEGALRAYREAIEIREAAGERRRLALTWSNLGVVYRRLGRYADAIDAYSRALAMVEAMGDERGRLKVLTNLGVLHGRLGQYERALELHEEALDLAGKRGDRAAVLDVLTNIGAVYGRRGDAGDTESALAMHRRALAAAEALDDQQAVCTALNNVGTALDRMARYHEALPVYERSLDLAESLGDRAGTGITLLNFGHALQQIGRLEAARRAYGQALEILEDTRDATARIKVRWNRAGLALREGSPVAAIADARRGVEEALSLAEGLAEGEGASVRELWAGLLEVGADAAIRARDLEALLYFVESARAGMLRVALGNAQALHAVLVPPELRRIVDDARAHEKRTFAEFRAARGGTLRAQREARRAWSGAKGAVEKAVTHVRRQARRGASIVYAEPDDLLAVRKSLDPGDALVLYAGAGHNLVALVVRSDGARAVRLEEAAAVRAAVDGFLQEEHPYLDADRVQAMRSLLVDPLGLGEDVARVLVSPIDRLGYVPFSLLLPKQVVTFVPSGTVYGLLSSGEVPRGRGVLGLGDPVYPAESRLARLPATRAEVESVATHRFLGSNATERQLRRALAERTRWRAVHLACHGLIDPERPARSSLSLTPGPDDDGMLTTLDVFGLNVPVDLAVLSACDTARGRAYRVEGIVGLTRAFMYAGAPRVICSLWKVDDEATQALMIKFYELWNPKDGKKGLGAAAALKKAQEFIRGHEKWKHPYYWAAWVLWGLPD